MADNVIRVAVGTPEAHSPTWRIWHSGPRDDLYVGTRALAAWLKVSFHASGDFRFAYTSKTVESGSMLATAGTRVISSWRPLEIKPGVWRTLAVLEPWFSATNADPLSDNVTLVPLTAEGRERRFEVVVVRAGLKVTGDATRLGPVDLPSATAWVLVLEQDVAAETLAQLDPVRRLRAHRRDSGERVTGMRTPTFGTDDVGVGFVRDVPIDLAH